MKRDIKLVAIDIDGTLVGPDQIVSRDIVEAVSNVSAAGIRVCLATGRTLAEALPAWEQLQFNGSALPIAVTGGALVAEPQTGRTLYQKSIAPDLAEPLAEALAEAGRTVLGVVDPWRSGVDCLVIPGDDYGDVRARWLARQPNARLQTVAKLFESEHDLLRITAILAPDEVGVLEAPLAERFGDTLVIHEIFAMNYGVRVFEAFAKGADKWSAVRYIAQAFEIGPGGIAACGDDVNDVPMLRGAGLGVAMPEGSDTAKEAADLVAEQGLAAFLRTLV